MSEEASRIELKLSNGLIEVMSVADFESALKSEARIVGATVSVKESRPRAQYQTHERFLSASIDFTNSWTLVDYAKSVSPEQYKTARVAMGQMMAKKILETEAALYGMIVEIQKKDNITPYNRTQS